MNSSKPVCHAASRPAFRASSIEPVIILPPLDGSVPSQTFLFRVYAKHPCTVGTCISPDTTIGGVDEGEFLPDTVVLLEPAHNVQARAASLVYQLTVVINLSVHHLKPFSNHRRIAGRRTRRPP